MRFKELCCGDSGDSAPSFCFYTVGKRATSLPSVQGLS